jgi:hypothetical protein
LELCEKCRAKARARSHKDYRARKQASR